MSGTSIDRPSGQCVAITWDYGAEPLPGSVVRSGAVLQQAEVLPPSRRRTQDRVSACGGGQAGDLSIGDPPVLITPRPPSRVHSTKGSATRSFNVCSSRGANQAPLRVAQPSIRLAPNPSVDKFPQGMSQQVVDNPVDSNRIAQAVLQAMGNPSLGHTTNSQPNIV
ncbi:hypothetical protein AMTR_s00096p00102130 [Amborella trichopoda]|uniref:Uncharacterized protein n=1 Tax=Amborella trichopoda TaxID=13333 RepID=W1P478_AMBTC|nr:hypothetical protein AMTR_s00096p00102130 [Amborella trichopoda]